MNMPSFYGMYSVFDNTKQDTSANNVFKSTNSKKNTIILNILFSIFINILL